MPPKKTLTLLLAAPRGFCAGVDRAVLIVERALENYGAPVYVRHEIVHNKHVVEDLRAKGAIFVEELDQVPDDAPVIFSAHGVPKSVPHEAKRRNMIYVDATCPLVSKVHTDAMRHYEAGRRVLLIGHAGHPEVIGTRGQLPEEASDLIETLQDAQNYTPKDAQELAFVTQTTLSADDTAEIIAELKRKFPNIAGPRHEDICYATTNRQEAVKAIAKRAEYILVIGAQNSSNSVRLTEVAVKNGCPASQLISDASEIDFDALDRVSVAGLTAGASAPEILTEQVIAALQNRYCLTVETVTVTKEEVHFKLPRFPEMQKNAAFLRDRH